MLSSKNIKLRKVMKKLSDPYIRPFQVEYKVGMNVYRLCLPQKYSRIYLTFHVSLLEVYHRRPGTEPPDPIDINSKEEFEVKVILDAADRGKKRRWLVKWKDWSSDYNTWEYTRNLANAQELVREFEHKL